MHYISRTVQSGSHIQLCLLELKGLMRDKEVHCFESEVIVVELVENLDRNKLSVWASEPFCSVGHHRHDVSDH